MKLLTSETAIGRQLLAGSILGAAAAAGDTGAGRLIAALAEAEKERVRAAKRARLDEDFFLFQMKGRSNDSERQLRTMADDFRRAVATAAVALRSEAETAGVRVSRYDRHRRPGTPAHCRHRRRA